MLSAQSCSWQGAHVFLLEAIPSKKGGILVTWSLRGGGVDTENERPRRPWPDCEGWAPQIAADIRSTRVDGSHAVGVR